MKYRKQSLGRPATFLLPSRKLHRQWEPGQGGGKKVAQAVEEYLLAHYGGYTAAAGNIFGEWRDPATGKTFYGEHREYSVAFKGKDNIPHLERFLATVAVVLNEDCIYMTTGEDAWLIYPEKES